MKIRTFGTTPTSTTHCSHDQLTRCEQQQQNRIHWPRKATVKAIIEMIELPLSTTEAKSRR